MAVLEFIKAASGLMPANDTAAHWVLKQKSGALIEAKVSAPVNGKFRRKFFAMLHIAYDNWDNAEIETPYGSARTSFETFRAFCIVKAGFYNLDVTPEGNFRPTPKSIAWAKMKDDEFENLYNAVLDVILTRFLTKWAVEDMHDAVVAQLKDFG